jgi:hypothetical protein
MQAAGIGSLLYRPRAQSKLPQLVEPHDGMLPRRKPRSRCPNLSLAEKASPFFSFFRPPPPFASDMPRSWRSKRDTWVTPCDKSVTARARAGMAAAMTATATPPRHAERPATATPRRQP